MIPQSCIDFDSADRLLGYIYMNNYLGRRQGRMGVFLVIASNLLALIMGLTGGSVSQGLLAVVGGAGTVGLIMVYVGMFRYDYKPRWLFWFMSVYSLILAISFPVGTAIGVSTLIYLVAKRKEFVTEAAGTEMKIS